MSFYQDDQERLRKRREALAAGRRPTLTRPGRRSGTTDPYTHNNYLNTSTSTKPVQGAAETGEITGSLFGKAKEVIGSAPSTKKDHLGNKPGFDFGDLADIGRMAANWAAPLGTKSFVKGALDPAAAKEGSGLLGLNAKAGANFRAGTGDLVEGTGNIMRWTGDKMNNETLQNAGNATAGFAEKHLIEDYENPYSQEFTWKSMLDPEWYASSVSRSMPFMLSMIVPGAAGFSVGAKAGAMIGNATKLGNFGKSVIRATAGGIGGTAATAPFESAFEAANVYKEALERGMSEQEADQAADSVFKNNLALLGISSVPELAAVFSPFKGAGTGLKGAAKNIGKVGASAFAEGAQEVGQEFFSADALGDVENFGEYMKTGDWKEPFAAGAVMGGGMNAFSKLGESDPITMIKNRIKERMSDSMKAETDKVQEEMKAAGADQDTIDEAVFEKIAETEEGQNHINEVTQEIVTKLSEQSDDGISVDGVKADEEEVAEPDDELMDVDEYNPGDTVFVKGMSGQFEVVDNSDPSMLVLKNKYGNELKVGRQAVNKDSARKDLGNAMESAVMTTAKEQLETLPENTQEPAGEEVAPIQEEVVAEQPLAPQEQLRDEVTQAVNEAVGVPETPQQRPDLQEEAKAKTQEIDETMKSELPGYVNGYELKDFKKGETIYYRHPRTGTLVESKVKAAKGKQLHVEGFSFHGDQVKDYVFKKDESYVAPEETDAMDEYEDYGDELDEDAPMPGEEETLDDIRADLMAEHQEKNEVATVEEQKNEVSNVKRPVEGTNEVTVTSKNELINGIDTAAEEARKNKRFVAFENLHKPEIRALAVEFKQKFPDFYAAEIYKRKDFGEEVLSSIKFYPPEMWEGEAKWKQERNWKLKANPGQGRIIISKGETELVLEVSRSGKEDKDFTDEELFADDSYANYPRSGNAWRWKGNRRNTFDTIVTPTLEGLPKGVVFGQDLEMAAWGIKLGELRKWFEGKEYERPKPVRKKVEDLPADYQATHVLEDGRKVAIREVKMEGRVLVVQDEKGIVEKISADSVQPILLQLGDGGNQAEILSQFERNDYATIELDGKTQLVRVLNEKFTINVRMLPIKEDGRAASQKTIVLDINDPAILTMKKAERPSRKPKPEALEEPKNEAVEKYEAGDIVIATSTEWNGKHRRHAEVVSQSNNRVMFRWIEGPMKGTDITSAPIQSVEFVSKKADWKGLEEPVTEEPKPVVNEKKEEPQPKKSEPPKPTKTNVTILDTVDKTIGFPKIAYKETDKQIAATFRPIRKPKQPEPDMMTMVFPKTKSGYMKLPKGVTVHDITEKMNIMFFDESVKAEELVATFDYMNQNAQSESNLPQRNEADEDDIKYDEDDVPENRIDVEPDQPFYMNLKKGDLVWHKGKNKVGQVQDEVTEYDDEVKVYSEIGYVNKVEYWNLDFIEPYNDQDKGQTEEPAAAPAEEQTETLSELTILGYPAVMEEGKDTRNDNPIWKVKITEKVSDADLPKVKGLVKKFGGKFYNARHKIKEIAGWNIFTKKPEGIFDNAETQAAEESGAKEQETAGETKGQITLYHGTLTKDLKELQSGTWYTESESFAKQFAENKAKYEKGRKRKPVILKTNVDLSKLNLLEISKLNKTVNFEQLANELNVTTEEISAAFKGSYFSNLYAGAELHIFLDSKQIMKLLKDKGYDGLKTTEKLPELDRYENTYRLFAEIPLTTEATQTKKEQPKKEQNFAEIIANEYTEALNAHIQYLEEFKGKGVEQGGVIKNQEGEVQGRYGRISRNPQWYQEFYSQHGRKPNKSEYRQLAEEHLINGFKDEYGSIEPWYSETVERMEDDVDSLSKLFKADQLQSTREQWQDAVIEMNAAKKAEREFVEKKKAELSKPKEQPKKKPKAADLNNPDYNPVPDIVDEVMKDEEAPNVQADKPKTKYDKARDNLAWLDELADNADAYIKKNKNRMSALPLDLYAAAAIVGARKIAHGVVDFAEWSEQMMGEYGKELKLMLRSLYTQSEDILEMSQEEVQEYLKVTGLNLEVPGQEETTQEESTKEEAPASYNELVLKFAGDLSKKKVFINTVKAEDESYQPKQIIEMFSNQVRADVSAQMMDYLNEPNFDSDAWNKLTGEVGIRQIINAAIMNVQEGETNAPTTDTVRTDGKAPLAGTQAKNVPGNASERNAGTEASGSAGNSEDTNSGTDGERDESVRSTGTRAAANNTPASRGNKGRPALPGLENYRLSKEDISGIKGKKTTAEKNLEIIKLAKQIQEENRPATEEEKKKLVQFVGWGGLKPALEYEWSVKPEWKPFLAELKKVLTEEELDSARRSRLFAHYTAVDVIEGMYDGLQHLGFDGGRILEPAAGIGHFIGMLPDTLANKSRVTAVEIEPMTAQIGRLLYPKSDFRQMGFEKTKIANDFFDVAIGNVPFNEEGVFDKDYKPALTNSLHNYFFVKSLDKVREGGLVAFITSSYTMDSKSKTYRKYLASKAELVGAIRLPNNAFKDNAGTEVTTDIIILKKLPEGQQGNQDWVDTVEEDFDTGELNWQGNPHMVQVHMNKYFKKNPGMVIGEMKTSKAMYGGYQTAAVAKEGIDIKKEIAKRFKKLPKGVYEKAKQNVLSPEEIMQLTIPAPSEVKEGAFHFQDNRLYVKDDGNLVPSTLTGTKLERVKGLIKVRDAVRKLFYSELHEPSKSDAARKELNKTYDAFVKKHGAINSKANVEVFQEDPDFYVMSNIEDYDKDTGKATKAEIFTKSTIARYEPAKTADNAREAMAISLNEVGSINLARIKELTGLSETAIMDELEGLVFVDPMNLKIVSREEYLSGNVRVKLEQAETAAATDDQFNKNVDALKAVVPTDIPAEDITAPLGSPWIPAEYIRQFIGEHLMDMTGWAYNRFKAGYSPVTAEWKIGVENKPKEINSDGSFQARWGHPAKYNTDILEAALNSKDIKVQYKDEETGKTYTDVKATAAVKEKVAKIRDEWVKWVWTDESRKNDLVRIYNDQFNSYVLREYDGSHLTFPGMNPEISKLFRPYQKNAVYRATQGGNTLFAHAVGAGKTFEMIASMMELKRLGLVKKPMWVVPNHLVQQSAREFNLLYPSANVLVPSKKDLNDKNRKNYLAKIATRNFDVIIVPHSSFGKINVAPSNVERFMREQIRQLEEAIELEVAQGDRSDKRLAKTMENAKIKLENKMEKLIAKLEKDNDTASFEELGIDAIVLDEAHEFKNLMFATRRNNVGGLGNAEGSGKAFDLYMKVRYLNELNGGRGIIFATGTPISNSLAEMYHMMRYLAHEKLEELNINNFDAWANLFADIQNVLEMAPEGNGYRMKNKVKGIYNAPELLTMFRAFADVKTTEELLEAKLIKHPKTIREIVEVPPNPALEEKVQELVERAELVRSRSVPAEEDNMLKITNEGRYAALDVRILDPEHQDYPDNKVNYAKTKIVDVWKRTKKEKGTQLVFVDLSTPGKENDDELNFSVYDDLKNKLVRSGIPKAEIAFIHDAKNDDQKQALFDKVNSGEIRVLIGSSSKMGAGMNVQKRLKALHHLDVPWRPSDIEQREGRILRHGNINEEVEIYNYVQSGSFDAYMWQLIEAKAKIINRVMSGDLESRTIEDDSEVVLNASKMKAIASGDPRVFEYEVLKVEVQKLEVAREEYLREKTYNARRLHDLTQARNLDGFTRIGHLEYDIENYTQDQKKVQDLTGDKFKVKIGENTITNRTDAGKFLFAAIEKTKGQPNRSHKVGEFSGFDIQYMKRTGDNNSFSEELWLLGDNKQYPIKLGDEAGTIRSMEARLPAISRTLEERTEELERLKNEIKALESLAGSTFEKDAELQEKMKRRDDLAKALSIEEVEEEIILQDEEPEKAPKRSSSKAFVVGTDTITHNMTPKTAKDISDKLANVMNTVLRTGNAKGAAATYTPHRKTGNIKDKYLHNIRIAAHELGHHFEEYGFNGDNDELMEVAKKYYPAFDSLKSKDAKLSEGKAEIFTLYVLNPESARALAPITVEELENVVADNKPLEKAFKEIRELVEKDKNKAVFEKGLGSIALPSEDKKKRTIGDEYEIDSVPESAAGKERIKYEIGGRVKRFLTKYVDYKIPFADLQKARTQDGKDLVKMLAVTGNAEIMARKTFEGWATDHRGRYIINYRNRDELPDYLMDTYDELNALNPINAKADTPLIDRYKKFFQEHKDKERAILEAISSRSLQEISEDGMYLIQQKIKGHNASDALKEEAERIKKDHKENPEFAYFASIIQAYRAAERYARKDSEGNQKFTEVFMSEETALAIIEATRANFPGLEPLIREYTDNLSNIILTKLVAAGVTTEEARQRIEEGSAFYVPTYYAFKNPSLAAEARERKTAGQPIKGFQGKQAEVIDFLRSSIYKLMEVEQSVEFKRVLDEVESSLKEEGMGKFGEILPQNRIPKSVQGANIAKQVTEQLQQILGDDAVTIDQIEESIVNNVYTVFFPTDMLKDKAPILMNWHDNKRVYMRLAPDLYNSIRSMQPIHLNAALRVLSKFSGFTRHLAILNPRYFMNVISRDFFSTQIQRNVAQSTIKGFLKGAALAWGKDERLVDQYMNSGSFVSAQENILNSFKRGSVVEGLIDTKAKNWKRTKKNRLVRMISPSELLQWQEQINRYGVWEAKARELAAEYGIDPKKVFDGREPLTDNEFEIMEKILLEVGYEASEVTTNFRGHGTSESFRKVTAPITFLHGTIQGLYREGREMKQNPVRVTKRIMMGVLPMSILSWVLLQAIDDDGDDITSEMKDKYWIIPTGGGYIFIAKPFGYALPVSHMERFLDHLVGRELLGKEEARTWYEDFWYPVEHNLMLPFLPIYGTLALELYSNKTWYGGQIEGLGDQQKPKEMRFDADTSLIARLQADVMYKLTGNAPVSPKQFDYAVRGLFGEAGKVTLNTVDNLGGKDTPITRNPFYTDKSKVGSRSVSQFYDTLDKMEDEHKRTGEPYKPTPELKRQREAQDYMSLFRKVEDEVKTSDLPAKQKMQYEKQIATAKKDLARVAAGRQPHNRESLMEIVALADRYKELEKQRKKAQR